MSSIQVLLRKVGYEEWQLYTPEGHTIGPRYRGNKYKATEWARAYISTWSNWTVKLYEGDTDETTDRLSQPTV